MIKIIVTIRDEVAEIFNDPRVEINAASAIRSFAETVKDHPHKNDFSLYQLGAMDDNNGEIISNNPLKLYSGFDVEKEENKDIPEMLKKQAT